MSALETFGALVAPHDPQEFLERFWGRQPVLIPALPERSRRWPVTIEELNRLFQDTRAIAPALRPWRFVGPDNKIAEPEPELDLIEVVTNAGTVCFDDIEHHSPAIAGLVSDLKVALSHPGRIFVSTYVSGRSGGFAHHLDYHPVFVVQLAGSKHWTYGHHPEVPWSPVIIANPRNAVDAEARFPWLQASYPTSDTAGLAECELAEGGVLYLPAGTWHQARATSDLSVALSIACVPLTVADLVDDLIRGYLGPREPWRASIPPVLCTNDLPSDQLPEPVSRFLADRIAELQAVVNTLTPADLYPAWAEHVSTSAAPRRPTPDLGAP